MRPERGNLPSQSAALAGIPAGIQSTGPWFGRRQLFVKFAIEAETATIYTSDALRGEVTRSSKRSRYHSIAIVGRDSLGEAEFLAAAFKDLNLLPLMLDHDGQRPAELELLLPVLSLVQVTLDGSEGSASLERVCATVRAAGKKQVAHAVALVPSDKMSDGPLLRIVEQVHEASGEAQIVVHLPAESLTEQDRRWALWLEGAMAVHPDVRILPRWPTPSPR